MVGVLYRRFTGKKLAVLVVHLEPVFLLAISVTVSHEMAVAAALRVFLGIRSCENFSDLPLTVVTGRGVRKAGFANSE